MAEDSTNPFASILGALQGKSSNKKTGVRKDGSPGAVSATLTPSEVTRYKKIFGIMKDVVNPEVEAKRLKSSSKDANIAPIAAMTKAAAVKKEGLGIGGMILGLAGLAGVVVAAWTQLGDDVKLKFKEIGKAIGEFGLEALDSIGHLPVMAMKLAKMIPIKRLKMLPLVGSLLNFGFAYKAFDEGDWGVGLWELASGIAGLVPGVGSFISMGMDMIMYMYESNNPKDEAGERNMGFGDWLWNKSKEIGGIVWQAIVDGKVPLLSGMYKFGEGIGYFVTGNFAAGLESWSAILPAMLGQGDNEDFLMAFDAFTDWLGEGTYNMAVKAKSKAADAMSWIGDLFSEIGDVIKGMFTAMKDWVDGAISGGIDKLKSYLPDWLGGGEGAETSAEAIQTDRASMIARQTERKKYIDLAKGRLGDNWKKNMSEGESNLDYINRQIDKEKRRAYKGPYMSSLNDGFISKGGNVTAFNNQDDILAAKSGGPIDKLLDANSAVMNELNTVNKNQLNVLVAIRDGINIIVANTATRAGSSVNASGSGPDINLPSNPLTQQFYAT